MKWYRSDGGLHCSAGVAHGVQVEKTLAEEVIRQAKILAPAAMMTNEYTLASEVLSLRSKVSTLEGVLAAERYDYKRAIDERDAARAECERLISEGTKTDSAIAKRVVEMCKKRGWPLHWAGRGVYLHLEASELIESLRGKRGDPVEESADVLMVLMSITESAGIPWNTVVATARRKVEELMVKGPYPGEFTTEKG